MKAETKAIFKKHRVDADYGEYGIAKDSLESDLYERVIKLESQLEERDSGIIVNGWKIEETKHLSAGFLTWRARNLQTGNEYIGKTKKECIVWCENLTSKTK